MEWSKISKLAWQDSDISYVIKYKSKLETNWILNVVDSSKSSVTLEELKPNSNYTFFVYANNSVGVGPKSEKRNFTTNSSKSLFSDDSPYPQ